MTDEELKIVNVIKQEVGDEELKIVNVIKQEVGNVLKNRAIYGRDYSSPFYCFLCGKDLYNSETGVVSGLVVPTYDNDNNPSIGFICDVCHAKFIQTFNEDKNADTLVLYNKSKTERIVLEKRYVYTISGTFELP